MERGLLKQEVLRLRKERTEIAKAFQDPITLATVEDAVQLHCGHVFSNASIRQWLQQNGTCPVCKAHVGLSQVRLAKRGKYDD